MKKAITLLLILSILTGLLCGCSSGDVSDSLRKEIQDAYRKEFLSAWERNKYEFKNEDADTVAGMQYYGTYHGYVILMEPGMLTVISGVQIGPCSFQWGSGDLNLYAYQDGTFHDLKDVYEAGELTDEEIRTIAQAHKAYFKKHHNWDYDIEVEVPPTSHPTISQPSSNQVLIFAPLGSVTNSNTHNGETYSFELGYEIEFSESEPNSIIVTLSATNLGKDIEYQGNEDHLFSRPKFTLVSEEVTYTFPEDLGLTDDEATARVLKTGETVSNSYHISIPTDVPAGCYDLNFTIQTVRGTFEDVLTIAIAEQTAFPVTDSHFTVANDALIPENTAYAPYQGYVDRHDLSTADRIAEVKENNGVLSSLGMIQLTFQDELPRSVTWKTFDRYGTADKNNKKIITNPADVTILNIDMPLGFALNSSLATAHEWYVEITCVYSDRTVAYLLVMEIPPITP